MSRFLWFSVYVLNPSSEVSDWTTVSTLVLVLHTHFLSATFLLLL